tara:strand:+ start:10075 stop:10488 length:414 start_codon:yes stop_codon:yes gene_type:complete
MREQLIKTQIISPDKEIYNGSSEMVVLPGEEGDFAAMYEHAPLITFLRPGKIEIFLISEKEKLDYFVSGGFVKVQDNKCIVMVDYIKKINEINIKDNEKKISDLLLKLDKENDSINKNLLLSEIEILKSENESTIKS